MVWEVLDDEAYCLLLPERSRDLDSLRVAWITSAKRALRHFSIN